MVLLSTVTIDSKPIDDLLNYLQGYADVCEQEFNKAFDEVKPPLLDELKYTPEPRSYPGDYPIEWTSEKQRKAYFASDGFGGGIPYRRTGNLPAAWAVTKSGRGTNIIVIIGNPNPEAQFVYGSLAKSNPGRFQQRFHKITGWETASDTVNYWVDALYEEFYQNMKNRLAELTGGTVVSTRGYTNRRGKR